MGINWNKTDCASQGGGTPIYPVEVKSRTPKLLSVKGQASIILGQGSRKIELQLFPKQLIRNLHTKFNTTKA